MHHFLKNLTKVRKKRYGSIIDAVELVTFLINRNNICQFKGTVVKEVLIVSTTGLEYSDL